jgi:hypothetical protein
MFIDTVFLHDSLVAALPHALRAADGIVIKRRCYVQRQIALIARRV